MNFFQYIRSLVPALEKRHVLNDIRMLREDMVDITRPAYYNAVGAFASIKSNRNFKSKQALEFGAAFDNAVNTPRNANGNFIQVIELVLGLGGEQLNVIEDAVKKHFAKDIITSGITYRQANILRYCELLRFVSKYARLQLVYTLASEASLARGDTATQGKEISVPEQAWLRSNRNSFMAALNVVIESGKDLARTLDNVPDVIADPDAAGIVMQTMGGQQIDPTRMNRVGFNGNPFYHLRMVYEDIMTSEYEIALEEKRMLELRLLDYEQAQAQEYDAGLEQTIEATRARIEKLKYRIAKRERDAGGE